MHSERQSCCVNRRVPYGQAVLRILISLLLLAALGAPLLAQEQGGEATLTVPDLNSATFLNGIGGRSLLMGGLW